MQRLDPQRLGVIGLVTLVATACAACGGARQSSGAALPAPVVKQIKAAMRTSSMLVGASSATTADVYGPASRVAIEKAWSPGVASTSSHASGAWYLIVLHGHFHCNCPMPPGAKAAPGGKIAMEVWSPGTSGRRQGGTGYSVANQLPAAVSKLGRPVTVSLG